MAALSNNSFANAHEDWSSSVHLVPASPRTKVCLMPRWVSRVEGQVSGSGYHILLGRSQPEQLEALISRSGITEESDKPGPRVSSAADP